FEIPEEGYVLQPGVLYLGVTLEYTETHAHVPFLEGKSSTGRLGIDIHATAGKGDVGFCSTWSLEMSVALLVRVYAGMPIGQLIYFVVDGEIETFYSTMGNARYNNKTLRPVESMMWNIAFSDGKYYWNKEAFVPISNFFLATKFHEIAFQEFVNITIQDSLCI